MAKKKAAGGGTASKARGGRKLRAESPAATKIDLKGDGDLLDALKTLKGLVSAHGADKVKSMVDLLS